MHSETSETDLVVVFASRLNDLAIPYMITGSVAGVMYGEPRVTHDVDLVAQLSRADATRICDAFPLDEFYCPPAEIILTEVLRSQRGHFNLIHHRSGFKCDLYVAHADPFHRWALDRRSLVPLEEHGVYVAPIEYVIVRKLEFFREGRSDKHLRDIRAMLRVSPDQVHHSELERWIETQGVREQWELARGAAD